MLQDVIPPPHAQPPPPPPSQEQLLIEDISSPISDQMFSFCENELFLDPALQKSRISSSSNYFYGDNSCCNNVSISSCNNNNSISSTITTNTDLSFIYDVPREDNHDNVSMLSTSTFSIRQTLINQEDQFDISALLPLNNCMDEFVPYQPELVVPGNEVPLPLVFGDDCLSSFSGYGNLDPISPMCSVADQILGQFMPGVDASGIYDANIDLVQPPEVGFQGETVGVYGSELLPQCFSSCDNVQQGLCNDIQQPFSEVRSSTLTSEISSFEESAYKVGKLSVEERKERIHRYIKKRNERNFSKKIKYACRKTLADSRPRVRGRFARNGEFGEGAQPHTGNQDDEDEEVTVKDECDMVDSSDIFVHVSGRNSFKCEYQLQSWT